MLGEPDPAVAEVTSGLTSIVYDGEAMEIRDRSARAPSCECYAVVRDEYDRLLS